jgi:hypothetical protein
MLERFPSCCQLTLEMHNGKLSKYCIDAKKAGVILGYSPEVYCQFR